MVDDGGGDDGHVFVYRDSDRAFGTDDAFDREAVYDDGRHVGIGLFCRGDGFEDGRCDGEEEERDGAECGEH